MHSARSGIAFAALSLCAAYSSLESLRLRALPSGAHVHAAWRWEQRVQLRAGAGANATAPDLADGATSLFPPAVLALLTRGGAAPPLLAGFALSAAAGSWDAAAFGAPLLTGDDDAEQNSSGAAIQPGLTIEMDFHAAAAVAAAAVASPRRQACASHADAAATARAAADTDALAARLAALGYTPADDAPSAPGPPCCCSDPHALAPRQPLAEVLATAEAHTPRLARALAGTFLGAAGAAAMRLALRSTSDETSGRVLDGALPGAAVGDGAQLLHGARVLPPLRVAGAAVGGAGRNDLAAAPSAVNAFVAGIGGGMARAHAAWADIAAPLYRSELTRRLLDSASALPGRSLPQLQSTGAHEGSFGADIPLHHPPRSGGWAAAHGSTVQLVLGPLSPDAVPALDSLSTHKRRGDELHGLRLRLHTPPSTHSEVTLLSPATLLALLGNGAAVARLDSVLRAEDADAAATEAEALGSPAARIAAVEAAQHRTWGALAAPSGHVPCASSAELPYAVLHPESTRSTSVDAPAIACPLTSLEMLGLSGAAGAALGDGDEVSSSANGHEEGDGAGSWCSGIHDGSGGLANVAWDCDAPRRIGMGVGIASMLVAGTVASTSRWHAISIRAATSRDAAAGGSSDETLRISIAVEAVLEVPPPVLATLHAMAQPEVTELQLPIALLLGLTHPRDAPRCFASKHSERSSDGGGALLPPLVLRSCPLQPADVGELELWSCAATRASAGMAAGASAGMAAGAGRVCGWQSHALAALPALALQLPVRAPTALPSDLPAVSASLERRLSAPSSGEFAGATDGGGGVGRATLVELLALTFALPHGNCTGEADAHIREGGGGNRGSDAMILLANGSVLVEHDLPWFVAPTASLDVRGAATSARTPLCLCGPDDELDSFLDVDGAAALSTADGAPTARACSLVSATELLRSCSFVLTAWHQYTLSSAALPARGTATLLTSRWSWELTQPRSRLHTGTSARPAPREASLPAEPGCHHRRLRLRLARSLPLAARSLLHGEELPADVHRGLELPGARVLVESAWAAQLTGGPRRRARYALATRSLLWEPHTPDRAMPYNVMVLAGAVFAFALGGMVNVLARRQPLPPPPATAGAHAHY